MTERAPWSETASALEQQLLAAARADRVPGPLAQHMRQALGATAPAAIGGGLAWPPLAGSVARWSLVSLMLLGAAAGWQRHRASQERASAQPADAARTTLLTPTPTTPARDPSTTAAPADALSSAASRAPALAAPSSGAAISGKDRAGRAPRVASASSLRAEIALLDRARAALQRRAPKEALRILALHAQRFAQGTLQPEAEALRIEAVAGDGEQARAAALARRFLETHPAHPLSDQVARFASFRATARAR